MGTELDELLMEQLQQHPPPLYPATVERASWRSLALCSTSRARALLPYELALEWCALPLTVFEDAQSVLCLLGVPVEAEVVKNLRFHTGLEVTTEEAPRSEVLRAIFAAYNGTTTELVNALDAASATAPYCSPTGPTSGEEAAKHTAPIPNLLHKVISRAITLAASDIHLEPHADGYRLRHRVDGLLQIDPDFHLRPELAAQLVRRIKVLCTLDPTQTLHPLDGAFDFQQREVSYRIRVSTVPHLFGEKIVLRLHDYHDRFWRSVSPFETLGLTPEQRHCLTVALGLDSGIVIAAGPTGSGKSSLLYAAVDHLNTPWRNIATIEDPIERTIPGVNQIELSPHTTFHKLLPALLRQDPDVFLIGEMRNRETAETAFHAATTGHLALTSVHAANCIDTVLRLDHLIQNRTLLSSALRLIVSGRLLPLNCKQCLTPHTPAPELGRVFGIPPDTMLSSSSGCEACHGFGHRGRIGAFEILTCGEELRRALLCNERLNRDDLQKLATKRGYRPFAHEVRRLLLRGAISPEAALRALGIAPEFFHAERG